jgi:hypothetical protein
MDRDEAVKLLKGGEDGVREWNRRRERGEEIPDLSYAALNRVELRGADLRGASLRGATLRESDLIGAALSEADLRRASLRAASLIGADLRGATLRYADLVGAALIGADLRGADLRAAVLGGADLSQAVCESTSFGDVDLSAVKGLEAIKHHAPSTIGVDTLVRSRGKIPQAFLRGCGVPDPLIVNLAAAIGAMRPIQFASCFLSHHSKDQPFADRLRGRLERERLRVWDAPEDLRGGLASMDQINQANRVQDKLLLVLSRASMASEWVGHEVKRAVERERREKHRVLFPIGLTPWEDLKAWSAFDLGLGKDVAQLVREYQIPDFSNWKDQDAFEAAFARLLRDLKAATSTDEETKGTKSPGTP